jgi:hypothetical protein
MRSSKKEERPNASRAPPAASCISFFQKHPLSYPPASAGPRASRASSRGSCVLAFARTSRVSGVAGRDRTETYRPDRRTTTVSVLRR